MNTVFCPVKNAQINGTDCYLMCDVADNVVNARVLYDGAPNDSILPLSIKWNEEQRQKCQSCKWHADVGDEEE